VAISDSLTSLKGINELLHVLSTLDDRPGEQFEVSLHLILNNFAFHENQCTEICTTAHK
jgi:hypothetical protein